jgi:hypothetical protein
MISLINDSYKINKDEIIATSEVTPAVQSVKVRFPAFICGINE